MTSDSRPDLRIERALLVLAALGALVGCESAPSRLLVTGDGFDGGVLAKTARLLLLPTYVGRATSRTVAVTNTGAQSAELSMSVQPPFTLSPERLTIGPGASAELTVTLNALTAGRADGLLTIEALTLEVQGEVLAAPTNCQAATCDELTGCRVEDAADGAPCGLDDCTTAEVCLAGSCVTQARTGASCSHRWLPTALPMRNGSAMAYDAARQRVLLFGGEYLGAMADTWEWLGTTWVQRHPATSPSPRSGHSLAYDRVRKRVVLFGGFDCCTFQDLSDTWEWDGSNWQRQNPLWSPPPGNATMTFDTARERVVLFSRRDASTWEWDGLSWEQRITLAAPSPGAEITWDGDLQRVVGFDGSDGSTWFWNGATWARQNAGTPGPRSPGYTLAWAPERKRLVLFGGGTDSSVWESDGVTWFESIPDRSPATHVAAEAYDEARHRLVVLEGGSRATWEWDGTNWVSLAAYDTPDPGPLAWDSARQQFVLFDGRFTWIWKGSRWDLNLPTPSPSPRGAPAMAFDSGRGRVVLFGGSAHNAELADTWEWDGSNWTLRTPAVSPPGREGHAMAFDVGRQRVVLFGGVVGGVAQADTWEWDGTTWTERTQASGPRVNAQATLAYDGARQRVVLFDAFDETWEWDGRTWSGPLAAASPSTRSQSVMAYDTARQRVVLYGGFGGTSVNILNDTWEWDGSRWLQQPTLTSPDVSYHLAMGSDDVHQQLLLVTDFGTWRLFP